MAWRVARSLEKLRSQINAHAPDRNKASDGTIGDAAHSARVSFHNPDANGIVRALDITHDPDRGIDIAVIADELSCSGDHRIHELICNRRYWSKARPAWRAYTGVNPHTKHFHITCVAPSVGGDDDREWVLPLFRNLTAPAAQLPHNPGPAGILREGSTGAKVTELQRVLNAWYPWLNLVTDGRFGPKTKNAVMELQRRSGLVVDGIAGPKTLGALRLA